MSGNLFDTTSFKKKIPTPENVQQLKETVENLKTVYRKYSKYKVICDGLQEVADSSTFDSDLKLKIQNILLENECPDGIELGDVGMFPDYVTLLGLKDLKKTKLNHTETVKLGAALESVLQKKYAKICEDFQKLTDESIHYAEGINCDFNLSKEDKAFFTLMEELRQQQLKYLQNLVKQNEIVEDFVKLRVETLPQVCKDKLKECAVKSKMYELQTQIIHQKSRIDIFMENSHSLEAYRKLLEDLREQQRDCQLEIQYLKDQKEKYEMVKCKQFDELLKSYVEYKLAIEKFQRIYETLM